MKKILLFVVLILVGLESFAQARTDNPILTRKYEEGYTIEQIKNFALGKMEGISHEYSSNYRKKLLSIINEGLKRSGEYVNLNDGKPLGDEYIEWIYENVYRVQNDSLPPGHTNTWRNGNQVSTTISKKPYYGPLDHFKYGVCHIKLDKPSCANLVPDYSLLGYVKQIEPKKSNQKTEPEKIEKQENTLVDYGNKKKLEDAAKAHDDSIAAAIAKAKENAKPKAKTKKKFFKRTGVQIGAFVIGTGLLAGGLYALLHKKGTAPEHATMSGGRPFDETQTTTGETPSPPTETPNTGGGRGD